MVFGEHDPWLSASASTSPAPSTRPGPARHTNNLLYDLATLTGMYLAVLMTPLAIGISILRYRLWGIDVLINRTLVYVPLTAILAGIYSAPSPCSRRSSSR